MSSNLEDTAGRQVRYYGMQLGTVVDNADPLGLHRVRVQIPTIAEPSTDWCLPLTMGGGSPQRGGHVVPAMGADVAVWFHQGDPNGAAVYAAGWWGAPTEGPETPADVKGAPPVEAFKVQSLELDGLRLTIDERDGQRAFSVSDMGDGSEAEPICRIAIDREQKGILVEALSAIVLRAPMIHLDGTVIRIGDRVVTTTSKPI